MRLPTLWFVGVGPQRTGTTWLDTMLRHHPDLCLPRHVKETRFFELHHAKGIRWYRSHFVHCRAGQREGEIGPTYFDVPEVPGRIRALNPDCRIIVTLRSPVERTLSMYRHHHARGLVRGEFREAVRQMPRLVDASRYSLHLPRWLDTFGRERVLVLRQEEIRREAALALGRVYDLLEVPTILPAVDLGERVGHHVAPRFPRAARLAAGAARWLRARRLHRLTEAGKSILGRWAYAGVQRPPSPIHAADRQWLREELLADVEYVERLLGVDLAEWRAPLDPGREDSRDAR